VPATDVDLAEAKETFNTNFFGVVQINQTFLPLLLRSKGTIVHIGSVAAIMPFVFGGMYVSPTLSSLSTTDSTSDIMHPRQHYTAIVTVYAWS
jgi:1-acylglycerone phosphate reductase